MTLDNPDFDNPDIEWLPNDTPREMITGPVPLPLEQQEAYRQKMLQEWSRTTAGQLCQQFYTPYQAYKNYLAAHPFGRKRRDGALVDSLEHRAFQDLLAMMERGSRDRERARLARRCGHRKSNGLLCGSPRMRGSKLCYAHQSMQAMRPEKAAMPLLEDPNAIQLALMKVVQALVDGRVDMKLSGQLLYALQIAASNVGRLDFEPYREEEESGG
ncbi:MAG TPA: hypothetical protein VI488_06445 [Candidatus Angelobacter sp.]